MARDKTAGPDSGPEPPFPIRLNGRIVKGFGRGSKELGIPTANIPISGLDIGGYTDITNGVYFGWVGLSLEGAIQDSSQAAAPPAPDQKQRDGAHEQPVSAAAPQVRKNAEQEATVLPAVLSIGYNPYYKNEKRALEVHIMHSFKADFYNAMMNLSIMGFIRPEQDYESMQALIDDINTDIEVAKKSLERSAYAARANDPYLRDFAWGKNSSNA